MAALDSHSTNVEPSRYKDRNVANRTEVGGLEPQCQSIPLVSNQVPRHREFNFQTEKGGLDPQCRSTTPLSKRVQLLAWFFFQSGEERSRTPAPEGATIVSNDVRALLGFLSSASLPWLPAFLAHLLRFQAVLGNRLPVMASLAGSSKEERGPDPQCRSTLLFSRQRQLLAGFSSIGRLSGLSFTQLT